MKKIFVFMLLVLIICSNVFANGANEDSYPSRSIELVVPANAGGGTDLNARVLASSLQNVIGQPVAIVNISGGAGTIAAETVLDAPADGYKALYFHADLIINSLMGMSGYDWKDKFKIAGITSLSTDYAVIVDYDAPYNNISELIDYVKSSGTKLRYAMETGGIAHVLALAFQDQVGIEFNLVDVGGASEKISNLLGGHVDIITMPYGNVRDYVANKDFKVIGIMGSERSQFAPEIPTFKEQGIDIEHDTFFFVAFSKDTPDSIVEYMSGALEKACQDPGFIEGTNNLKYSVAYYDSQDAYDYMVDKEQGYKEYVDLVLKAINN